MLPRSDLRRLIRCATSAQTHLHLRRICGHTATRLPLSTRRFQSGKARPSSSSTSSSSPLNNPDASPWEILGVDRRATYHEIKAAYHRMAAKHHPDALTGDGRAFLRVQEAWEKLSKGPAPHMVFGRDGEVDYRRYFWFKVEGFLAKYGIRINWKNYLNRYDLNTGGHRSGYFVVFLSVVWFLWVCDPIHPEYLVYVGLAYLFDQVAGTWFALLLLIVFWWKSLYDRDVQGFFRAPGAYWQIDRPNSLTISMGIPNYYWREDDNNMYRGLQKMANRQAYPNLAPKKKGGEEESPAMKHAQEANSKEDDSILSKAGGSFLSARAKATEEILS